MIDSLPMKKGLFADLNGSFEYVMSVYELRIYCLWNWDDLTDTKQGEILYSLDKAKAIYASLQYENKVLDGSLAWQLIELGQLIGFQHSQHITSLSRDNSLSALKNANERWKKLKQIFRKWLSRRAVEEWRNNGNIKLSRMAQILTHYSPMLIEEARKLSKEKNYSWMEKALEERVRGDQLSSSLIRNLLVTEDECSPFIPAAARTPGPSKGVNS